MKPIDKRKAELREYIRKQEVEAEYLKDLSANKSAMSYYENAQIAKQLLECIVFIEMLQCEYYYSIDGKMQRHFDDCKRCKILNKIAGEK